MPNTLSSFETYYRSLFADAPDVAALIPIMTRGDNIAPYEALLQAGRLIEQDSAKVDEDGVTALIRLAVLAEIGRTRATALLVLEHTLLRRPDLTDTAWTTFNSLNRENLISVPDAQTHSVGQRGIAARQLGNSQKSYDEVKAMLAGLPAARRPALVAYGTARQARRAAR